MAIVKATLAKDDDNGTIVYVYPKTTSDIVDYDENTNIKEKINDMMNTINSLMIEINKIKQHIGIE